MVSSSLSSSFYEPDDLLYLHSLDYNDEAKEKEDNGWMSRLEEDWGLKRPKEGISSDKNNNEHPDFPPLLQSQQGKVHLEVISSWLKVPTWRAVQLTFSAMRSSNSSSFQGQEGEIGSATLILNVVAHHYQQQVARLQLFTELIKQESSLENDEQNDVWSIYCQILSKDKKYHAQRQQEEKCIEALYKLDQPDSDSSQILSQLISLRDLQDQHVQLEAWEGLVMYFYESNTISWLDFTSKLIPWIASSGNDNPRIYALQAIVTMECTNLGSTLFSSKQPNTDWNVDDVSSFVQKELLPLLEENQHPTLPLTVLSLGLWLVLQGFNGGNHYIQVVNQKYEALDVLQQNVLQILLPLTTTITPTHSNSQEVEFNSLIQTMLPEKQKDQSDDEQDSCSAAITAYASIAHEIVIAMLKVLKNDIFRAIHNVNSVCQLLSHVYLLPTGIVSTYAQVFWEDWNTYCNDSGTPTQKDENPLCPLLDVAYSMATSHNISLQHVAPFLVIISSWLYNDNDELVTEVLYNLIPSNLLHNALNLCMLYATSKKQSPNDENEQDAMLAILQSFSRLIQILKKNKDHLIWFLNAIEMPTTNDNDHKLVGPYWLFQIAATKDVEVAWYILGDLIRYVDEPKLVFQVAKCCQHSSNNKGYLYLWQQLSQVLCRVALSIDLLKEHDYVLQVQIFLQTLGYGANLACHVLATRQEAMAINMLQKTLHSLRIIVSTETIHTAPIVKIARHVQTEIITTLSNSTALGNMIAHCATMIVSNNIKDELDKRQKQSAFNSQKRQNSRNIDEWSKILSKKDHKKQQDSSSVEWWCQDMICNVHKLPLSQESTIFSDIDNTCVNDMWDVTYGALSLMLEWGRSAEDICMDTDKTLDWKEEKEVMSCLQSYSPVRLLLSLAVIPHSSWSTGRGGGMSNLNLISRYLYRGSNSTGNEEESMNCSIEIKVSSKASQLITLCLKHLDIPSAAATSKEKTDIHQKSVLLSSTMMARALGGGNQMHASLVFVLEELQKRGDNGLLDMAKSLTDFFIYCFDKNPPLAIKILLGNANIIDGKDSDKSSEKSSHMLLLLISTLKKIRTASTQNIVLASSSLKLLSSVYGAISKILHNDPKSSNVSNEEMVLISILTKSDLLSTCSHILLDHSSSINQYQCYKFDEDDSDKCSVDMYVRGEILCILSNTMNIMASKHMLHNTNDNDNVQEIIEKFWDIASSEGLGWSNHFISNDVVVMLADCQADMIHITKHTALSLMIETIVTYSPESLTLLLQMQNGIKIEADLVKRAIRGFSIKSLTNKQLELTASWSEFCQVHSTYFVEANSSYSRINSLSLNTLDSLFQNTERTIIALSKVLTYPELLGASSHIILHSTTSAYHIAGILEYLLIQFCSLSSGHPMNNYFDTLQIMLLCSERCYTVSQYYDGIPKILRKTNSTSYYLRLRVLNCASLLVQTAENNNCKFIYSPNMPGDSSKNTKTNQKHAIYVGLGRLACETLNTLVLKSDMKQVDNRSYINFYERSRKASDENADQDLSTQNNCKDPMADCGLKLLQVSISLLSLLIPISTSTTPISLPFSASSYDSDLVAMMKQCNLIPNVMKHFENASAVAKSTYHTLNEYSNATDPLILKDVMQKHKFSIDIVQRILDFFQIVASGGCHNNDLCLLLVENQLITHLINNQLLKYSTHRWSLMNNSININKGSVVRRGKLNLVKNMRGYTILRPSYQHNADTRPTKTPKIHHLPASAVRVLDPVHKVWCTSIHIISALLQSFTVNSSQDSNTISVKSRCLNSAIDFICAFEDAILSCLFDCTCDSKQRAQQISQPNSSVEPSRFMSSSVTTPISEFTFTPAILTEAGDIVHLLSELCNGEARKTFKANAPNFYETFVVATLSFTKTLSSFLGSIGTARELFAALSTIDRAMGDNNARDEGNNVFNEALDLHPLLIDGIPNARHEAIRNAHYAKNCSICITAEDYSLSLSESDTEEKKDSKETNDSSLEQSFQNHVNNEFTMCVEKLAGSCLFHTLSIIDKTHPASSSFVYFEENEVSKFNTSMLEVGMIVAFYTNNQNSFFRKDLNKLTKSEPSSKCSSLCFGKVNRFNSIKNTVNLDPVSPDHLGQNSGLYQNIPFLAIVGIEDVTRRNCSFDYIPAPKLVSENFADDTASLSLGHLILALRWCRGQASTRYKVNHHLISKSLVGAIAEKCTLLLGTELSLHHELKAIECVPEDTVKKMNKQLLELFDDEEHSMHELQLSSQTTKNQLCKRPQGLQSLIHEDVWKAAQQQLNEALVSARHQLADEKKILESNGGDGGVGALGWTHGLRRSSRRSPFRMFSP